MGIMIKCLLFLDVSIRLNEHILGDSMSLCMAAAGAMSYTREDKIVGTPFLISLLYQEPEKIHVYVLLKWDDVVSFFFFGLHTLTRVQGNLKIFVSIV